MFVLAHAEARRRAIECITAAPAGFVVTVREPARTVSQNAALWPLLDAFSRQLKWPVNGRLCELEPDEWKDLLSAAFEGETRVAEGLNGGSVILGQRTSQFSKKRFSEFLEFLHSVAAERGVNL